MGTNSTNIAGSVFRRTVTSLDGQVAMSAEMLDLLILLDGRTSVREVGAKLGRSPTELRPLIEKLVSNGVAEEARAVISRQFLGHLTVQLSRIAGPIARMMVEDAVWEVGKGAAHLPLHHGEDLIAALARQIPDRRQRAQFVLEMRRQLDEG